MGNKTTKLKIEVDKIFSKSELNNLKNAFLNFYCIYDPQIFTSKDSLYNLLNDENEFKKLNFNLKLFIDNLLPYMNDNIKNNFINLLKELNINNDVIDLNSDYNNISEKHKNLYFEHYLNIVFFLYKSLSDQSLENTKIYFNCNYCDIILDCLSGKINVSRIFLDEDKNTNNKKSNEYTKYVDCLFYWLISTYLKVFNIINNKQELINKNDIDNYINEMRNLIHNYTYNCKLDENKENYFLSINRINIEFPNLEPYIIGYIRSILFSTTIEHKLIKNTDNNKIFSHPCGLPIPNEIPKTISLTQYLLFCLKTPQLFGKPNAFKLFDCSESGFNLSNLIYSFLGFPDPVVIFVYDYDKITQQEIIVGSFLNSKFKESYDSYVGDDLSFVFNIDKKRGLKFCKYDSSSRKILYINTKSNKYSSNKQGLGMGNFADEYRFWLDFEDLFKSSYFGKYDTVFENGSLYNEDKHFLNVILFFI